VLLFRVDFPHQNSVGDAGQKRGRKSKEVA
jgi:hypothetical protein